MGILENKIAIITGSGRGIGEATAKKYSEEGATVIIADSNKEFGEKVAKSINSFFVEVDISKDKSETEFVDKAEMEQFEDEVQRKAEEILTPLLTKDKKGPTFH